MSGTVLVTGAAGFVGARLARALLEHPAFADATIVLTDTALSADPRASVIAGDIADPAVQAKLLATKPELVFHLAGVLGGAAEADYATGRRVNLDATLALLEGLRDPIAPPRVVFASSIAVFGPPLPARIDDDTPPHPVMNYGAHKRMIEVALEQFSARGWLDGIALRLPGIVARPAVDTRLNSAFLSAMFRAAKAGEAITLPVSPEGTTWLLSVEACVDALIDAALLPRIARRTLTLPAQRVAFGDLVGALERAFPQSAGRFDYAPDDEIEAQFGRQPPLATPAADALGFVHDGDLPTLIERALAA